MNVKISKKTTLPELVEMQNVTRDKLRSLKKTLNCNLDLIQKQRCNIETRRGLKKITEFAYNIMCATVEISEAWENLTIIIEKKTQKLAIKKLGISKNKDSEK